MMKQCFGDFLSTFCMRRRRKCPCNYWDVPVIARTKNDDKICPSNYLLAITQKCPVRRTAHIHSVMDINDDNTQERHLNQLTYSLVTCVHPNGCAHKFRAEQG